MLNIRAKKAVSLVELLIAILVVSITVGIILQSYTYHLYLIETARGISTAVADARDIMEKIFITPSNDILHNFPDNPADDSAANAYYKTLVGGYTLNNQKIIVSYTDTSANPLEVICTLTWTDSRGVNHSVSLVTFRTR